MILGIDEVGRGPWAGPLVVGAVVLGGETIDGLTDSKKLSKKRRGELDIEIHAKAKAIGLGWVDASEIDEIGLSMALKLATKKAVRQIKTPYHEIIIDGTVNFLTGTNKEKYVTTLKKADLLVPCVSAASIVAKVARDDYMAKQDNVYSGYKFKTHVGYGTADHRKQIEENGLTPLHRLSFLPIKKSKSNTINVTDAITTKKVGDEAENIAAEYLVTKGHEIVDHNWKTKYCEIDIVSKLADTIYFTEVKYRKKPDQGGGLAAITKKKLNQMKFAVKLYVSANKVDGLNLQLNVASLSGEPIAIDDFLELQ